MWLVKCYMWPLPCNVTCVMCNGTWDTMHTLCSLWSDWSSIWYDTFCLYVKKCVKFLCVCTAGFGKMSQQKSLYAHWRWKHCIERVSICAQLIFVNQAIQNVGLLFSSRRTKFEPTKFLMLCTIPNTKTVALVKIHHGHIEFQKHYSKYHTQIQQPW